MSKPSHRPNVAVGSFRDKRSATAALPSDDWKVIKVSGTGKFAIIRKKGA